MKKCKRISRSDAGRKAEGKMEKMTFFEINDKLFQIGKALDECVDEETGEIISEKYDELADQLKALELAEADKTEGIALMIKDKAMFLNELKTEKKRLSERMETVGNEIDRMKRFLDEFVLQGRKFETARVRCQYRKTKAVEITDESLIPAEYIREKVTTAPDKTAIKEAIAGGDEVPGCNLRESNSLSIK